MTEMLDDGSYYSRTGTVKKEMIYNYVMLKRSKIATLYDVGCNTGVMSHQFIKDEIKVLGVDGIPKNTLELPVNYNFVQRDVVTDNGVYLADCTLFLSLYHHLFGLYGIDFADKLFYQFLLRTKYLIFDTGIPEESKPARGRWVTELQKHFQTQKQLLDHFGVRYTKLGSWRTKGGASRDVVVFERPDFDEAVRVLQKFKRKIGWRNQASGLHPFNEEDKTLWDGTVFYKLQLGRRFFFAKKWVAPRSDWEIEERKMIVEVYNNFPKENLLTFYGFSLKYGFLYEWVDDFKYVRKIRNTKKYGVRIVDTDTIKVDGVLKYIDFARPPNKNRGNMLKLEKNEPKYYEFIRQLRIHFKVAGGFISQQPIDKATHLKFMEEFGDHYYICLKDGDPVGFVGDVKGDIRIATDPDYQRQGIARFMLTEFMKLYPHAIAKIKDGNEASIKLFESVGFKFWKGIGRGACKGEKDDLAIVVNTHTSCMDLWYMFFKQLQIHWPKHPKIYVFVDKTNYEFPDWVNVIFYDNTKLYREQFLSCLKSVTEDYVLYMSEDYILYKDVQEWALSQYFVALKLDPKLSFLKLIKGPDGTQAYKDYSNLFEIPSDAALVHTQQATIWKTAKLLEIYEQGPDSHIGVGGNTHGHFEVEANKTCKQLNISGIYCYDGESKRGQHHYDSSVFPYIATAVIKGKWNLKEYEKELGLLLPIYYIDVTKRGTNK